MRSDSSSLHSLEFEALRHMVEASSSALAFYDADLRLVAANGRRLEEPDLAGRAKAGMALAELWGPEGYQALERRLDLCLKGEAQDFRLPGPVPGREVAVAYLPSRDASGAIVGFVELRKEVEAQAAAEDRLAAKERELAAKEAELRRLATTDTLSGALNRATILSALEEEVRRASRYGRPLSLVLFDFDHFKLVNDIHGQEAGDEAIKRFSALCAATFRNTDFLGRYGGEEFLAILPEVEGPGAILAAERVREGFQEERFRIKKGSQVEEDGIAEFTVTVSAGIAAFQRGYDMDRMLAAVDGALYRAKEKGRNRIEVHGKR